MTPQLLRARLRPSRLLDMVRRKLRAVRRDLERVERRVVTLEPAGSGAARGEVLLSYIIDPFLLDPDEPIPHHHTNYWESRQMARTFSELGYRVDAIHWTNQSFEPRKDYSVLVDARLNLELLGPKLGPECLKIMHIETAHPSTHNPAQLRRLEELTERRGVHLRPRKMIEPNRAIENADVGIALGNSFTQDSYRFAGKPLYRVPISTPLLHDWRDDRDWETCRRHFVWFGSGGLVHKGLDRVLEAFAAMPDIRLNVCGPVERERDFEAAYFKELYQTPNIHTTGWLDIESQRFVNLMQSSLGVVYPSCSEGGGGSVIGCMHFGLIPVASYESSVDVDPSYGCLLADSRVETIRESVRELVARPLPELKQMAHRAWEHARSHHTRQSFADAYRDVVRGLLEAR